MITFLLMAGTLSVLTVGWISLTISGRPPALEDRAAFDMTIFRDQLREVDIDHGRGLLSDEEAGAARLEIERRILHAADQSGIRDDGSAKAPSKILPAVIAAAVPAAAFALYFHLGSPDRPDLPHASRDIQARQAEVQGAPHQDRGGQSAGAPQAGMASLVQRLARRLKDNPTDVEGWLLLGRSYMSLERFEEARQAHAKARDSANGRLDVEVAYAEILILTSGMTVTEEARTILAAVSGQAPFEPKSRYYLALAKAQNGDLQTALRDWVDLIAISPNDAPWLPVVRDQISRAARELNVDPAELEPTGSARNLANRLAAARAASRQSPAAGEPRGGTRTETASAASPGPTQADVEAAKELSAEDREAFIRSMVDRLASRLRDEPNDADGWKRLLRAYRVLGETEKAARVEERLKGLPK